ncbi:MAG: MFS transporter [Deltaproteobacteria bacterium]|nr:MFS transporter [Deltaproteobacteria bacterium]MCW5802489.1 MFS transporter [Deltaproteobacteria bacterium]
MATPLTQEHRSWRRKIFFSTWLAYVGFYFCRKPFSAAKADIAAEAGWTAVTLGDIYAVYLIAYTIGQFLASQLGPRLGPRRNVILGMCASIAVTYAMGVALDAPMMMGLIAVNGVAQATGWSGTVGTMANWTHKHERGRVMGLWSTNFTIGSLTSGWVMAWVLSFHDEGAPAPWRWCFFVGGAVLIGVLLQFYVLQRNRPEDVNLAPIDDPVTPEDESKAPEPEPTDGRWGLSRAAWTNLVLVGGFYFFAKFIRYAVWSWSAFFLKDTYGLSSSEANIYSTAFDLMGLPGVYLTGWVSDRYFGSRRAGVSLAMMLGMCVATGLLVGLGGTSFAAFAILLGAVGFTLYGPDALLTGAGAMDIGGRRAATFATAVIATFGALGPVVQEVVIPRVYEAGRVWKVVEHGAVTWAEKEQKLPKDLTLVFVLLFASAVFGTLFCLALTLRNRRGGKGV